MITGELKGKVDRVWDAFWSGGISNPLEVIEQIIYLLFWSVIFALVLDDRDITNRPPTQASDPSTHTTGLTASACHASRERRLL